MQSNHYGCMVSYYHAEPLLQVMALPIRAHIEALKEEVHEAKKKASEVSRRALEGEKTCIEAPIKINYLRGNIKQMDQSYSSKKKHLTEACLKLDKTVKEASWSTTKRVS